MTPIPRNRTIVVTSQKGGTGRTTTAAALAWLWGDQGITVRLCDAEPLGSVVRLACGADGQCDWKNVILRSVEGEPSPFPEDGLTIVDGPSLSHEAGRKLLTMADGVVLTCLADPLSFWTLPQAARAVRDAQAENPRLQILGLLLTCVRELDPVSAEMLKRFRAEYGKLLLEPPVPCRHALRRGATWTGQSPHAELIEAYAPAAKVVLNRVGRARRAA